MSVMKNISECISRIVDALEKEKKSRTLSDVTLVVASKAQEAEKIKEVCAVLSELKVHFVLGENYVQEWDKKRSAGLSNYPCHLIGHLQSNKAKKAKELFSVVETVDSLSLAGALESKEIYLQVNISNDKNKHGINPKDLTTTVETIFQKYPKTNLCGLMTITADDLNRNDVQKEFSHLKELRDRLSERHNQNLNLSMGMSSDYEIALLEGATHIRLGTALFGSRTR